MIGVIPVHESLPHDIEKRDDQMLFFLIAPRREPNHGTVLRIEPALDGLHQCSLARAPAAEHADGELCGTRLDNASECVRQLVKAQGQIPVERRIEKDSVVSGHDLLAPGMDDLR